MGIRDLVSKNLRRAGSVLKRRTIGEGIDFPEFLLNGKRAPKNGGDLREWLEDQYSMNERGRYVEIVEKMVRDNYQAIHSDQKYHQYLKALIDPQKGVITSVIKDTARGIKGRGYATTEEYDFLERLTRVKLVLQADRPENGSIPDVHPFMLKRELAELKLPQIRDAHETEAALVAEPAQRPFSLRIFSPDSQSVERN